MDIFKSNAQNIKTVIIYTNYCIDFNYILHIDKDQQILFVGGPNAHITNPKWRMAAILKKKKNRHISATAWPIDMKFDTVTYTDPPIRISS